MKNNIIYRLSNFVENLGVKKQNANNNKRDGYTKQIVAKNISRARKNISDWTAAQKEAEKADKPKRVKLAHLYKNILLDGHITSQINIRKSLTTSADFKIHKGGEVDEELTKLLKNSLWFDKIVDCILESVFYGHTLMEFNWESEKLTPTVIPYANVVPNESLFYPDYSGDKAINYREAREYGVWLLEFGESMDLGILNKCVPYSLFKRFATHSWAQLIEIFGIPPRIMKTDTTNIARLNQAENMMQDMASAPWLILDQDEMIEWGKAVVTDGEIYDKFLSSMKEEISLIILGAQLGQDTKNGNRSKEESSQNLLQGLVKNDKKLIQNQFNAKVIPALEKIGVLPVGCELIYAKEVDIAKLWKIVEGAMGNYDFDIDWLNNTFGIQVVSKKENTAPKQNLSIDSFFD